MSLARCAPAAEQVDARGLLAFLDAAERHDLGLHSLMALRHGRVIAEGWWAPYSADRVHLVYSLSKTVTASAIGLLAGEGRLALEDPVLDHLPASSREVAAPGWEAVRLEHCLSMTVGHDVDAWPQVAAPGAGPPPLGQDWLPRALATTLQHEPGTHFAYNQVATYLLSLVVRERTGTGVADWLRPRLLEPMGLPDVPWHRDPLGRELGFSGAHLTTEGIASLAQLYLDEGRWQGRALLPVEWVTQSRPGSGPPNRASGADPDWCQGYRHSFWGQRHGYRGDGAYGQFLLVLPDQDAVLAITSENDRMQDTLDALWQHVLPAFDADTDEAADRALADRLAVLEIPPLRSASVAADAVTARVTGGDLPDTWNKVRVSADGARLELTCAAGRLPIAVGDGGWRETSVVAGGVRLPVVASGGWQDAITYAARILLVETPHSLELRIHQEGGGEATADLQWRRVPLNGPDPFASGVHPA